MVSEAKLIASQSEKVVTDQRGQVLTDHCMQDCYFSLCKLRTSQSGEVITGVAMWLVLSMAIWLLVSVAVLVLISVTFVMAT